MLPWNLVDRRGTCRKSATAYPWKLARYLLTRYNSVKVQQLACSGATATKPDKVGEATCTTNGETACLWLHNQVNAVLASLSDRPTLVSITIGADDFHFSDLQNFLLRLYIQNSTDYNRWVNDTAGLVQLFLQYEVQRLTAHPSVAVVITQVYDPFNQQSTFFQGLRLNGVNTCLLINCYQRVEGATDRLDSAYDAVGKGVAHPGQVAVTTGLRAAFKGHESPQPACGAAPPSTADTWIQYKYDPNSNANPTQLPPFLGYPLGKWSGGDCIHPNDAGAQAYADSVNRVSLSIGR